jgi:uncharacterized repeat protein (TIGR01451 family)
MKSRLAVIAVGVGLLAPLAAMASTAANTVISNTATVNYNDAGGAAQTPVTSAAVTVTVTLVASAPSVSSPPNPAPVAQGSVPSVPLSYTITSTANGLDSYTLSATVTPSNMTTVTATLSPTSLALGGTTLAAAATTGDTSITVPYDGVAGTTVNGIGAGSVIVIGGNAYTVASVTKNAAANTATIALSSALTAGGTLGSIVGERKTFTASVPPGTVTTGPSGTQTVVATGTSVASPGISGSQTTPTVITVTRPVLTVAKFVSTDGGVTFGANGTAQPGTVLTYKIVASNTGTTDATTVAFTDVVPQYLTYVAGQAKFATTSATSYSAATALTENAGGYTFTPATNTVSYNPGGATGTVPGGSVLVLFFQAKIN